MVYPVTQRELSVHLDNGRWAVRPIEEGKTGILGPVDYGCHRNNEYPDSFTFGEGLLTGSSIPGARRLVFCAFSPQWDGFYVSSMGGAAYTFHGLGVNYVGLQGASRARILGSNTQGAGRGLRCRRGRDTRYPDPCPGGKEHADIIWYTSRRICRLLHSCYRVRIDTLATVASSAHEKGRVRCASRYSGSLLEESKNFSS